MKIAITALGAIEHANVELGDLTLICGENNTGKTYVTYGIYGFLSFWNEGYQFPIPSDVTTDLLDNRDGTFDLEPYFTTPSKVLDEACKDYRQQLPVVFAAPRTRFTNTRFEVTVEPSQNLFRDEIERSFSIGPSEFVVTKPRDSFVLSISLVSGMGKGRRFPPIAIQRLVGQIAKEALFGSALPRAFIISAERTGAAMFKNELNLQRNRLIEEIGKTDGDIDPFDFLTKAYSDYPLPVKANIDFARRREAIHKQQSFIAKAHKEILIDFEDILGGEFYVDRDQTLRFIPKGTKTRLSMDESSSSVRSLLDLGLYLACVASPGDLLVIDEPELNLHPRNQRRVARLLSQLVRIGMKVLVTTHSDYLIKELNLLVLMNTDDERIRTIAEREKYSRYEALDPSCLRVYVANTVMMQKPGKKRRSNCRTLSHVPVNDECGIAVPSFDQAIDEMNGLEDELLYGE